MNWYLTHIASLDTSIQVIFYGILVIAFLVCILWARPNLVRAEGALSKLQSALRGASDFSQANEAVVPVLQANPFLQDAWDTTQSRVIAVGQGTRARQVLLSSVDDVWQPERLLQRRFNFAMFEAIPNVAVGLGLLFTFVFLTLALTDATAALTVQSQGTTSILDATRNLLGSAGGKFMSSLAGLFVSLCWTIWGRRRMVRLQRAASAVVEAIERLAPPVGAELVVVEQMAQLQAMTAQLAAQQSTLVQSQGVLQDQQALTEELLTEAREQTGSLKRFETDLAVSIGNAITNSFGPQMEAMTQQLVAAINGLSDRMGSMNEDALSKMLNEFSEAMRANTSKEMGQFKDTLSQLAKQLEVVTEGLGQGVGDASDKLSATVLEMTQRLMASTQEMSQRITEASHGLADSIQGVDQAMDKARSSVQQVDATIERAATLGAQGLGQVEQTLSSADQVIQRMGESGRHWEQSAQTLARTAGQLAEVSDGVEELAQEQRAVVAAVRAATPEALQAVSRMSGLLDESARSAAASMTTVQESMARTSRDLSGVVATITDGVGSYTQQVAVLHQSMDTQMAKAVSSLTTGVSSLSEAIDELIDGLPETSARR